MTRTIALAGTPLELVERGQGRPLLFLHAGEGLAPERPWLDLLSRRYRVIAPCHPGYGNSPLIDGGGSVDDLAYLYLDLAAELGLDGAVLVGADLGGWIAAEMMVRSSARFSRLVLTAPLGIKLRGRDERDIADIHAMTPAEYLRLAWADARNGDVDRERVSVAVHDVVELAEQMEFLAPRAREEQCLSAWVRRAAHWQGRAASAVEFLVASFRKGAADESILSPW
jgi:pimeloyl-ACP methyl ester carboxylesterase